MRVKFKSKFRRNTIYQIKNVVCTYIQDCPCQNSKTPKTRDCHPKIKGCTRSWQFEFKSSLEHELHDKK